MAVDRSIVLWRLRHNTARPDIVAADQPQPVDPLRVGQLRCAGRFGVHAAPPRGSVDQPEGVGKGVWTWLPARPGMTLTRLPHPDALRKSGAVSD
jgi:hypothetical protein